MALAMTTHIMRGERPASPSTTTQARERGVRIEWKVLILTAEDMAVDPLKIGCMTQWTFGGSGRRRRMWDGLRLMSPRDKTRGP